MPELTPLDRNALSHEFQLTHGNQLQQSWMIELNVVLYYSKQGKNTGADDLIPRSVVIIPSGNCQIGLGVGFEQLKA